MAAPRSRLAFLVVGVVVSAIVGVAVARRSSDRGSVTSGPSGGGSTLAVGASAPTASLSSTRGDVVNLADFRGKRNMLLFFYEHAG